MSDTSEIIPEGYEVLKAIETSGSVGEYIALHKDEDVLIRLRIFKLSQTSSVTTRRQLREYLRCNITFMEELEHPGILRIYDYSDTKTTFWIATQPAEIDKLSGRFDFLATQSFEFRRGLVTQFLDALQRIHESGVIHRNLSGDSVFLSSKLETYIGEFGFACYFTNQPAATQNTIGVTTIGYQPPEVRHAQTFSSDVSCDIFSAGLLAFEVLSSISLPKDDPAQTLKMLRQGLKEELSKGDFGIGTADVILKAIDYVPQKRWTTAKDFANALQESLENKTTYGPVSDDSGLTVAVTKPIEQADRTETIPVTQTVPMSSDAVATESEAPEEITPLDPSHEIWNDHYEIIEKIGEGGQAIVYKAYDHLTAEEIAIKTIWSRHRGDRAAINRLKQGAMIARSLTHRYIIKTYSVEQRVVAEGLDKYVFICMELIKSQLELSDVIEDRRSLERKFRVDEVLHIIRQLLDALAYAHEHTIHRDIKPGNIMLVPRQEQEEIDRSDLTKFDIRLIDFGIAKVLSQKHIDVTGKGFRSAHYGAPELADASSGVDARADIFSVGVMMYQMLTLSIPRKGSPPVNKVNKEVSSALAKVIDKAINADREKRFKTVLEFSKEIDSAVSKFNWVRKAVKIAVVLMVIVSIVGTVKYFLPEHKYIPLGESLDALRERVPERKIAEFDAKSPVKYSDIEGYNLYDEQRQTTLEDLKTVQLLGQDEFPQNFPAWKKQKKIWDEIEPSVAKIESIAQNKQEYDSRKNIAIADHLMKLSPSSEILSEVKDKAEKSEPLLNIRPLSQDTLDICAEAYDLGAKVYTNIEVLSGDSVTPETAEQINKKLINVQKLRTDFLSTRNALDVVGQLKNHDLRQRSAKCLEKATRYYKSFELKSAEKSFVLLNQIVGTLMNIRGQINFSRSNIGLISSRLLDLCYEDIKTFEDYPDWQERLEKVYQKKDVLARYRIIHGLLSKVSKDVPSEIYQLTSSAIKRYEQGNLNSASSQLDDAFGKYKKFMRSKISDMTSDCDSLSTFSFVSIERLVEYKSGLEGLAESVDELELSGMDFIQEYIRYSEGIENTKNQVSEKLIQKARNLKKEIIDSANGVRQQDYFFESDLIEKYTMVAQQYDASEVDSSIEKWKYVSDFSRLSAIVSQMETVSSYLDRILTRRAQLAELTRGIDEGLGFCEGFKGVLEEERKKYDQLGTDLKVLRARLIASYKNTHLIDQSDEMYTSEYDKILSAYFEIRGKLPFHRSRVVELINRSNSLEEGADYLIECKQLWDDVFGRLDISIRQPNLSGVRSYLESVKEEVDKWSADDFNQKMQDRCRTLADELNDQFETAASIILRIREEKSKITEGMNSFEKKVAAILNDEDIRRLENITVDDNRRSLLRFRQIPGVLHTGMQKLSGFVLEGSTSPEIITSKDQSISFDINTWWEEYTVTKTEYDTWISQLKSIKDTVPIFEEIRQVLSKRSSIEEEYYLGLRDSTVSLIDYSKPRNRIERIETDSVALKMCQFLEKMKIDNVPKLTELRISLVTLDKELANLKSFEITSLTEAKNFNKDHERLLSHITVLEEETSKLEGSNLESTCRQSVTLAVNEIAGLIDRADADHALVKQLTSTLWSFYPDHKDWSQWNPFLKLFHITVSGEDLWLSSSKQLKPVNSTGDYLKPYLIGENPTEAFCMDPDPVNFGWPRYISHLKDPTVKFAYVLGTGSADIEPFYMAVREINNAQYKLFMEEIGAKPTTNLAGWSFFGDQKGNLLVGQAQGQFPPCRITWDESAGSFVLDEEYIHDPVTWLTSYGSQAYAQWFGAQLPTVLRHAYAARAGATTQYPWGEALSNAKTYAHVRNASWQRAVREYNSKRDNPVEIAYPPVGAIKDFLRGEALDPAKIVYDEGNDHSVWACYTDNIRPNNWGLYDMIGNVWEWCIDIENDSKMVICGGSSLSPPEYIRPGSKYEFDTQACDVGFRIVIPAQ